MARQYYSVEFKLKVIRAYTLETLWKTFGYHFYYYHPIYKSGCIDVAKNTSPQKSIGYALLYK